MVIVVAVGSSFVIVVILVLLVSGICGGCCCMGSPVVLVVFVVVVVIWGVVVDAFSGCETTALFGGTTTLLLDCSMVVSCGCTTVDTECGGGCVVVVFSNVVGMAVVLLSTGSMDKDVATVSSLLFCVLVVDGLVVVFAV